jgi:DNA helicase HerA-like ATPase
MNKLASAYLHTGSNYYAFAINLQRITTLTALGWQDEKYLQNLMTRQVRWLSCLINAGDERVTYDLRFLCTPDPDFYLRGKMTIALLCRVEGFTEAQTQDFAYEALRLCEAFFDDEYEFSLITRALEFDQLLTPFSIKSAAEISRRSERLPLDTLPVQASKPALGFPGASTRSVADSSRYVYHVSPYLKNAESPTSWFKLLLMQKTELAVSFRLCPTKLKAEEAAFLEDQIMRCERYAQIGIGNVSENLEAIRPTLKEQARSFQKQFTRALSVLKDSAALLRIEVVGAERIPQTLVHGLASHLTQPAGGLGTSDNADAYLTGGYKVDRIEEAALPRITESFVRLDLPVQPDSLTSPCAERLRYLFDSQEVAAVFCFPPPLEDTPGMNLKASRTQMAPAALPEAGHLIGVNDHNGYTREVRLRRDDRRRHIYALGQTGSGKSTMFEAMIVADMQAGEGLCVIDPHGDLIRNLLHRVPDSRTKDVILFEPFDTERPIGLNMLEVSNEEQKDFAVQEMISIFYKLVTDPAMLGPMFEHNMRNAMLTLLADDEYPGTLVEIPRIFTDVEFQRYKIAKLKDPIVRNFWEKEMTKTSDFHKSEMLGYLISKVGRFVENSMIRNIVGQAKSGFNFRQIMDEGKIILVNLAKGRIGEINAKLLGLILVSKIEMAALSRADVPESERRDFYLYVDEFQNFITDSFASILSEARKYRLNLVIAHQYLGQLEQRAGAQGAASKDLREAVFGNVGTRVIFRTSAEDAEYLEKELYPVFNQYDLSNLPNFHTCVTTLIDGQVSRPFSLKTILDQTPTDAERAQSIREASRQRYGRMRREVEDEIARRLIMYEKPPDLFEREAYFVGEPQ